MQMTFIFFQFGFRKIQHEETDWSGQWCRHHPQKSRVGAEGRAGVPAWFSIILLLRAQKPAPDFPGPQNLLARWRSHPSRAPRLRVDYCSLLSAQEVEETGHYWAQKLAPSGLRWMGSKLMVPGVLG